MLDGQDQATHQVRRGGVGIDVHRILHFRGPACQVALVRERVTHIVKRSSQNIPRLQVVGIQPQGFAQLRNSRAGITSQADRETQGGVRFHGLRVQTCRLAIFRLSGRARFFASLRMTAKGSG